MISDRTNCAGLLATAKPMPRAPAPGGFGAPAVAAARPDLLGGAPHRAVGHPRAVWRDPDARPQPAALPRVRGSGSGFDPDHRRPDPLSDADHGAGIGVEQGGI